MAQTKLSLSEEQSTEVKNFIRSTVIFVLLWAILGAITKHAYDHFLPGVPDSGRSPIASLPWLLAGRSGPGCPWNDLEYAAVWLLAVATLFIPVFVLMVVARTKTEHFTAWIFSGILVAWALITIFDAEYAYYIVFHQPRRTKGISWFVLEPMLWAVAICAVGAVLGKVIGSVIDAGRSTQAGPQ